MNRLCLKQARTVCVHTFQTAQHETAQGGRLAEDLWFVDCYSIRLVVHTKESKAQRQTSYCRHQEMLQRYCVETGNGKALYW